MIPKKIHYCWFGHNQLPESAKKCINSWKKFCPSFDIIEWNEENFNIDACPQYVKDAYSQKKWAFVTDYVRLKVVYENGGIYFDTDVELISRIDSLLKYNAYFGFEDGVYVNTGLGFGAVKGMGIIKMDFHFILRGNFRQKNVVPLFAAKVRRQGLPLLNEMGCRIFHQPLPIYEKGKADVIQIEIQSSLFRNFLRKMPPQD